MSDLDEAAVKKLKVAELRTELQARGLDSKGNKPVLVERLLEAISKVGEENGGEAMEESATEPQTEVTEEREETADEENKEEDVGEEEEEEEGEQEEQEGEQEEQEAKADESVPEADQANSAATDPDAEQVAVEPEGKPSEEVSLETTSEAAPKEESGTQKQENVPQADEPMETNLDVASTSQTAEG